LDRACSLPALGKLDEETGEFWPEKMFQMPRNRQNLSAFEQNRAFLNLDDETFLDFSFASGCDIDSDSRSVVAADFNRDGATDLLVGSVGGGPLRLFLNRLPETNHRVRIELVGVTSNRQAIGARVIAHCGERQIVRDVFPANGFLGQGPAELLLGVGEASKIDRLSVRWPNGRTQEFADVPVDGVLTVVEGQPEFEFYAAFEPRPGHPGVNQTTWRSTTKSRASTAANHASVLQTINFCARCANFRSSSSSSSSSSTRFRGRGRGRGRTTVKFGCGRRPRCALRSCTMGLRARRTEARVTDSTGSEAHRTSFQTRREITVDAVARRPRFDWHPRHACLTRTFVADRLEQKSR
jgi:hypothetical protein